MNEQLYEEYKEEKAGILQEVLAEYRSTPQSNPLDSEGTIMDTMDVMMQSLSDYYKNGGK